MKPRDEFGDPIDPSQLELSDDLPRIDTDRRRTRRWQVRAETSAEDAAERYERGLR